MSSRVLVLLSCLLALVAGADTFCKPAKELPIIFFHGVTCNRTHADNFVSNLTAEGRVIVPLSFCENMCSIQSIKTQVALAIDQLRELVTGNPAFDDGYVFMAHSQGGQISRSVIELWDDHKVRKYVSLAGVQNGVFFNPQEVEMLQGMAWFNGWVFPNSTGFDYHAYAPEDYYGKIQYDLSQFHLLNPHLQYEWSQPNLMRSPHFKPWAAMNPHLPVVNNINPCAASDTACEEAKARRKANFLKLDEAHFFASAADALVTPWQTMILGQTSEVDTAEEIFTDYANLTIIDMKHTREYVNDTYGLQTLDARGGLFLHDIPDVPHLCWIQDYEECAFQEIYDKYVYPVLKATRDLSYCVVNAE